MTPIKLISEYGETIRWSKVKREWVNRPHLVFWRGVYYRLTGSFVGVVEHPEEFWLYREVTPLELTDVTERP